MNGEFRAIRRVVKRYARSSVARARLYFTSLYKANIPVMDNQVLFQAFDGNRFGGNPFYLLCEMENDDKLKYYSKIIAVKASAYDSTQALLRSHGFTNCEVVKLHTYEYCKALVSSKFLINNSTFPNYFIKRLGQIYLNTWHGTPLKCMGRKIADKPWGTGNVQRNFLMADYLLYPNDYSFNHFVSDYMIGQYFDGKYVLSGYPCNSIFYDETHKAKLRKKLGLEDKKIIAYLPTWRAAQPGGHGDKHEHMMEFLLENLDERLDEEYVVFAQLHYYERRSGENNDAYRRVLPFPDEYETYEVLSLADILITDYSSVLFDFLNANKEVVLFDYDRSEYFATRGSYLSIEDLSLTSFKDAYELCDYINDSNGVFEGYTKLKRQFIPWDGCDSARALTSLIFRNDSSKINKIVEGSSLHNEKPNILIYAGGLAKNGITSALQGLLENLDYDKANYLLTFKAGSANRNGSDFFAWLPKQIDFFPIVGAKDLDFSDAISRFNYYRRNKSDKKTLSKIKGVFDREAIRCFWHIHFDSVIHFTGYERDLVHLLLSCDAKKRIIFVHSNMVEERHLKGNFHQHSLSMAYREFDRVAVVREGLDSVMSQGFGIEPERIRVVHNLNKLDSIRRGAMRALEFGDKTESTASISEIEELLSDESISKFVSIGRFSPEKGLDRLLRAYRRYACEDDASALFIIGGNGSDYEEILEQAKSIDQGQVIVIKNLPNPFPILRQADAFIMSSLYEGLPMSIMEALVLAKPVVCTDIPGPRDFLNLGYGYIVPNNEEGLLEGFRSLKSGKLKGLRKFDAEAFNAQAIQEFEALVDLDDGGRY